MIEVRGQAGVLAVDDGGEGGPPCFLVHSLDGRLAFWNDVLTDLRQHRRAVALDLRGHGASEPASFAQSGLDDFADDVLRVADELGLKRFVLVDPAGVFNQVPASALEGFIEQVLGDGGDAFVREAYETNLERAVPATRAAVLESLAATDRATLAGAYTALFATDPRALLLRYPGPVRLIVDAGNDSPMSMQAQVPDLDTVPVAGASHWVMLDRPEEFALALKEFLDATLEVPP